MVWIGFRHFDNIHTGVAAATLYLLTFYTSQFTSQVDHVVPAMLLVWAVAAYRRPTIAGHAAGPGRRADLLSAVPAAAVVRVLLAARAGPLRLRRGRRRWRSWWPSLALIRPTCDRSWRSCDRCSAGGIRFRRSLAGFWDYYRPAYRIPVLAAFVAHLRRLGHLAGAKESRHAAELLRGRDAGHAVLARPSRRPLHGLVSAAACPDDLPAEPGGPRGAVGRAAGVEKERVRAGKRRRGLRVADCTRNDSLESAFSVSPGVEPVARFLLGGVPVFPGLLVEVEVLAGQGDQASSTAWLLKARRMMVGPPPADMPCRRLARRPRARCQRCRSWRCRRPA